MGPNKKKPGAVTKKSSKLDIKPKRTLNAYFTVKTISPEAPKKQVCRYGENCYQNSEQHRSQYFHSASPSKPDSQKEDTGTGTTKKQDDSEKHHALSSSESEGNDLLINVQSPKNKRKRTSPLKATKGEDTAPRKLLKKSISPKKEKQLDNLKDLETSTYQMKRSPKKIPQIKAHEDSKPEESKKSKTPKQLENADDLEAIFKNIYGVEGMPTDFYHFFKFCSTISPKDPTVALEVSLGFRLVGPFQALLNPDDFLTEDQNEKDEILCKWRYYYDPPEFQTCIVASDDSSTKDKLAGFHLGYYRDDPSSKSVFVAFNTPGNSYSASSCRIQPAGDNMFGAICCEIAHRLQQLPKNDKKRDNLEKLKNRMKRFLNDRELSSTYNLDRQTKAMKDRQKRVVAKCFHGAGISVMLDKNGVGYRELPETDSNLRSILTKITNNKSNPKKDIDDIMSPIQELVTLVQFANDECDFGMGLELGLDILSYGDPVFHSYILQLLPMSYSLLNRGAYSAIVEAHLKHRKKMVGADHWLE